METQTQEMITPPGIKADSKVWVPFRDQILPGVVVEQLLYGDFIVEVRGKQYQYNASQVTIRNN
ncbi:hypothetical protein JXQ70_01040 [bacterium]|nr:hypothetical protein [bacterium]